MKRVFLTVLLGYVGLLQAATLEVFAPGDPIQSSAINANFSALNSDVSAVNAKADAATTKVDANEARIDTVEAAISSLGGGSAATQPLQVFSTVTLYTGSVGRKNANDVCKALNSSATFCARGRIEDATNTRGTIYLSSFAGGWLDREISIDNSSGNCIGWTNATNNAFGTSLTSSGANNNSQTCEFTKPLVCCM